jgi:hypothetical protein
MVSSKFCGIPWFTADFHGRDCVVTAQTKLLFLNLDCHGENTVKLLDVAMLL